MVCACLPADEMASISIGMRELGAIEWKPFGMAKHVMTRRGLPVVHFICHTLSDASLECSYGALLQ